MFTLCVFLEFFESDLFNVFGGHCVRVVVGGKREFSSLTRRLSLKPRVS